MKDKGSKQQTGLRRGFLLGGNKKTTTKKKTANVVVKASDDQEQRQQTTEVQVVSNNKRRTASSSLMDLETPKVSPLIVLNASDPAKEGSDEDKLGCTNNKNSVALSNADTSRSSGVKGRPLIAIIDGGDDEETDEASSKSIVTIENPATEAVVVGISPQQDSVHDKDLNVTAIASRSTSSNDRVVDSSNTFPDGTKETAPSVMDECTASKANVETPSMRTTLLRDMAVILHRLRRSNAESWKQLGHAFVRSKANEEDVLYMWNSLLDSIHRSKQSKNDKTGELRLAVCFAEVSVDPMKQGLSQDAKDQASYGIRCLSTVAIVDFWLTCIDKVDLILSLLQDILPLFVHIALDSKDKRTVLAQKTYETSVRTLSKAVLLYHKEPNSDLATHICSRTGLLGEILDIQLGWIRAYGNADPQVQGIEVFDDLTFTKARDRCRVAVLVEWKKRCQRFLSEDQAKKTTDQVDCGGLRDKWCKRLHGIEIPEGDEMIGGLNKILWRSDTSTQMIDAGLSHIVDELTGQPGKATGEDRNKYTAVVTGVTAWLAMGNKTIQRLADETKDHIATALLDICRFVPSLVSLVIPSLRLIWVDTRGLPPVVLSSKVEDEAPKHFSALLAIVESFESKSDGEAHGLLYDLVAACILFGGKGMVETVFGRLGVGEASVDILTTLVTLSTKSTILQNDDEWTKSHAANRDTVRTLLLNQVDSNETVAKYLMLRRTVLSGFPASIPVLVDKISRQQEDDRSSNVCTSLLVHVVRSTDRDNGLKSLVYSLRQAVGPSDDENVSVVEWLCSRIGSELRASVLVEADSLPSAFGSTLASLAKEFIDTPSSLLPLTLYGSVAGQDLNSDERLHSMIVEAVVQILQLTSNALKEMEKAEDANVFVRLAPLLLLRRLPAGYFRLSNMHFSVMNVIDQKFKYYSLLHSIGEQIARRLGIRSSAVPDSAGYSAEELRLSAEIAGRVLPFGEDSTDGQKGELQKHSSCYQLICLPAFARLDSLLASDEITNVELHFKSARAAMYAACNAVQHADDAEPAENLIKMVLFALKLIARKETNVKLLEQIAQIQTGCVDFLSLCIDRSIRYQLRRGESGKAGSCLHGDDSTPFGEMVQWVYDQLFAIALKGSGTSDESDHQRDGKVSDADAFSEKARVTIWSCFLVATQRSDKDVLTPFANDSIPKILAWLLDNDLSSLLQQPFCTGIALRILFVTAAKFESVKFVDGALENGFDRLQDRSMELLQVEGSTLDIAARTSLRLSVLQLMLLMLSLSQKLEDGGEASRPVNYPQFSSAVEQLRADETDPQVLHFSQQLLSLLSGESTLSNQ